MSFGVHPVRMNLDRPRALREQMNSKGEHDGGFVKACFVIAFVEALPTPRCLSVNDEVPHGYLLVEIGSGRNVVQPCVSA